MATFRVLVENRHGLIGQHIVEADLAWMARSAEEAAGFTVHGVEDCHDPLEREMLEARRVETFGFREEA